MRKVLCLLLALFISVSMAACSGEGKESGTQETTTQFIFTYPTKEAMNQALKVQTEKQGLTLPEAEENALSQMTFYTYKFEENVKLVVKIDANTGTVVNVEIDTRKTISDTQKALLDKLMHVVVASVEPRETEEGINTIVDGWMNTETNGSGYPSSVGIIYTKETVGEEDMYAYYAKL